MNLSALIEEFAALGIRVTPTPEGDLSVKPRRLLTDELRERLRAAKAESDAEDDPFALCFTGSELHPDASLYWIDRGVWKGPNVESLPCGSCVSCRWEGVPLAIVGEESRCVCCWQADERIVGQPLRCQTFCECDLLRPSRFEPGGLLACPDCAARMLAIKERWAQRIGLIG